MTPFPPARWLGGLAASVALVGFTNAQVPQPAGEPIAEARARQTIADQKAQADVAEAIRDAERLARVSPVKAAIRLKGIQDAIDVNGAISSPTRQALVTQLQARLSTLDARSSTTAAVQIDPRIQAVKATKEAALLDGKKEASVVGDSLRAISQDLTAGRTADAATKFGTLQKAFPNNPAVIELGQQQLTAARVADSRELAAQQDKRVVLALNSVQRSALPALGDIEFPKDWAEKTRRRSLQVELTAKEKAIIEALDAPISLLARDRPFEEIVQELANTMKAEIFVDNKSLQDAGLDLKKPVSIQGDKISARTFLRQILAGQGLTFVVKDEIINVVTVEKAREMLTTRVYYLGDIVQGVGPFAGAMRWGSFVDYEQTMVNVRVILDAITSSIDPMSWKEKGGPGTVTFHFPSMSVVVRASTEVHATLANKLNKGR